MIAVQGILIINVSILGDLPIYICWLIYSVPVHDSDQLAGVQIRHNFDKPLVVRVFKIE